MSVGGLPTIARHSSRRGPLNAFLPELLTGARGYDRIAGYFRSSILEVAGEALESMADGAKVRVVCNSDLQALDVLTARAAKMAMYREWRASLPEDIQAGLRTRLDRLHGFLSSGLLEVRVLPDERFGFVHGKAGVVTRADGARLAFIGSANESRRAWELNYEIVWTDSSAEGVAWTQEEFDAFWNHPAAIDLAEAVVRDIARVARRVVVPDVPGWKTRGAGEAAAAAIELPLYQRENGLWAHQKHFVQLAFEAHKRGGARLLLADQVGLGKTVQLALAAKLMSLWSGGNVLVVAPKPLLYQWQDEIWNLLQLPSAVWTGRGWDDERGVFHPAEQPGGLRRCPRKVGIVSGGLVTQSDAVADELTALDYDCVIVDEAHKARRRNLGGQHRLHDEPAQPNKLLRFLNRVSPRATSMLLATATPVQLDPIEAYDLLRALNDRRGSVLGNDFSRWNARTREGLAYVLGRQEGPQGFFEAWEWMRNPLPPASENRHLEVIRDKLAPLQNPNVAASQDLDRLGPPEQDRVRRLARDFYTRHNPYIRHIVRRTRQFLEETIDPRTHEPYLKPVRVRLFGEGIDDSVPLPAALSDAYEAAEEFCVEVGQRPGLNSGFLKTVLLKRIGSTIEAGRKTALKMLGPDAASDDEDDDDETERSSLWPLTPTEEEKLRLCLLRLDAAGDDPKYREVERILLRGAAETGPWLREGCIIFSQYYDSARWLGEKLSAQLPDEPIAIYAGAARSGVLRGGEFTRLGRDALKESVRVGDIRLLIGTEAASEGLNLQRLGTLINLDLPWNPTRLEQRKGRIQRIGQARDEVLVYNLRYRGSVEDRVHQLLSARLKDITDIFGQLPDTLEDVWVQVALRNEAEALRIIDETPKEHPFELRYDRIEPLDWESCSVVLDSQSQLELLSKGW